MNKQQLTKIKFEDLCTNISVRIDNPKESETDYYVGLEHLDSEESKILRHGSPQDVSKTKLKFHKGDILFGKRNWYLRRLAVADRSGICSAHMLVLRPKPEKIISEFLSILMFGDDFYEKALSISAGSMSPTIKWKDLSPIVFNIPSIPVQKKYLEINLCIEKSIHQTRNLLNSMKDYKQSKLHQLLNPIMGTKQSKNSQSFLEIEKIPKNWTVIPLKNLVDHKTSIVAGPFGSNLKVDDYIDSGIPIIRLANIERDHFVNDKLKYISKEKFKELEYHSFISGDIIIAKLGFPIGKACFVSNDLSFGIVTADVVRISKSELKINPFYLLYILNSSICKYQYQKLKIGATRPRVNLDHVRGLLIPVPSSHDEQDKIVSILKKIDDVIIDVINHINKLKIMKKSILSTNLKLDHWRKN